MPLADRDRCQLDPVGDVADRPDGVGAGPAGGVDLDGVALVQRDAGRLQAEVLDIGPPPDRPQQQLGVDRLAAGDVDADAAVGLLDALEGGS